MNGNNTNLKKVIWKSLFYLAVLLFVIFSIGPILWIFLCSIRPKVEFFNIPPTIFPRQWTLENYIRLFIDTKFTTYLWNSAIITVASVFLTTLFTILGAYSLARFTYRGRNFLATFSLAAYLLPTVLLIIPLYLWFEKAHLVDSLPGLIIAYIGLCLPYCLWMLRSFFASVPMEIEEAASIDGASRLRTLFSVILPILTPGIIAIAVYTFSVAWNEYIVALVMVSSDAKMTYPVGLNGFIGQFDTLWEFILSGSVLVSIPSLILFLFTQKALIKGYSAGAVKG
jgi:multiple sugar transport system permease protein